jgi:hypothetical protein
MVKEGLNQTVFGEIESFFVFKVKSVYDSAAYTAEGSQISIFRGQQIQE